MSAAGLARLVALAAVVGVAAGCASALFLVLLARVTEAREAHAVFVLLLPAAGLLLGAAYERFGAGTERGTNLVVGTLRHGGAAIPGRMAPMVLAGTLLTHLFGGSAGREGTAVQMGASLADSLADRFRMPEDIRRLLLVAGVAGGFGSVFGTPLAGALFALEVARPRRIPWRALPASLAAAFVGDATTRGLGVAHGVFPRLGVPPADPIACAKWLAVAAAIAAACAGFVALQRAVKTLGTRLFPRLPLRAAAGGVVVVALWRALGTDAPLGLGLPLLARAFTDEALPPETFALKIAFTALTLGSGFIGGEVTPLFVVGATLGNALARLLGLPLADAAGVGLAALFGAASKTPVALAVMAAELLGPGLFLHALAVGFVAARLTGQNGLYPAQFEEPAG